MASTSHLSTNRIRFTPRGAKDRNPTDAVGYLTLQVRAQQASDARHTEQILHRGGMGTLQQGRMGNPRPHRWVCSVTAHLRPPCLHLPALHLSSTKEQIQKKKLRNGNKETSQRSSTMEPALPRAHKEEAQGSGQLQLYKVTQIFYLETAKPILISSISINNPTGCCNLAYKQREV